MLTERDILGWKTLPPDLKDARVSVIGLARSGIAAARLLHRHGCQVFASDAALSDTVQKAVDELGAAGIDVEAGDHTERVFEADFIVRSPGIPLSAPVLQRAAERNLLIVSEVEVASWFCKAPVIAITGSNGKTTTTEWLGDLFQRAGRKVAVCGNVGRSFSQYVDELRENDVAVVEVSSFQLENIIRFNPRVAVITNFSPDHLDRYDSYADYITAKCRIYANQGEDEALVYNRGDLELSARAANAPGRLLSFGLDHPKGDGAGIAGDDIVLNYADQTRNIFHRQSVSLPGRHNLENALAVACVGVDMQVPEEALMLSLSSFKGVPHRLEKVTEADGVLWVNDSKATNIASGLVALESFDRPIILLAGGRDKGSDFAAVANDVAARTRQVILFGEAGPVMRRAWGSVMPVVRVNNLEDAVMTARKFAQEGDVVLLSPMCASFDEFDNYEHRGNMFKQWVRI